MDEDNSNHSHRPTSDDVTMFEVIKKAFATIGQFIYAIFLIAPVILGIIYAIRNYDLALSNALIISVSYCFGAWLLGFVGFKEYERKLNQGMLYDRGGDYGISGWFLVHQVVQAIAAGVIFVLFAFVAVFFDIFMK